MTIGDEGKLLRVEITKLRPDKRRRYGDDLRRRIMAWVERAMAAGVPVTECSKALGIKTWRFAMWRQAAGRRTRSAGDSLSLVPIVMAPPGSSLVLVTPSGHRIEGLTVDQIVVVLRELA